MTDKHTPGPWGDDRKPVVVRGLTWVAHANYPTITGEANARLIEAAPELLQEVEWLLDAYIDAIRAYAVSFKRQPHPEDDRDVIRIRALIAKVRGTQ